MSSSTSVVGLELVKQSIAKNEVGPLPGVFPRLELDDFVTVSTAVRLVSYNRMMSDYYSPGARADKLVPTGIQSAATGYRFCQITALLL